MADAARYITQDTIVAAASPPGRAWRGILRLSGGETAAVLDALVAAAAPDESGHAAGRARLLRGRLRTPAIPVLVTRFAAPHGFTGQDAAELQLPGNPALLQRVVRQAIDAGARLAEPGEFTFRAFAAGRLDLTRAEGVAATIAAESDGQLRAAERLRDGTLGTAAAAMVDRLGTLLALTEAGIDFVDQEDVVPIAPADLHAGVAGVLGELERVLARSRPWAEATALPRVVLAGPPSSGKSTLFNALLGRRRALIDAMPGTTRDALAEPVAFAWPGSVAIEAMLVDVAGLDTPEAALDREAQAAATREVERADVVVHLHAPDAAAPTVPVEATTATVIHVASKADLGRAATPAGGIAVSVPGGRGLDELRHAIRGALGGRASGGVGGEGLALQPRHESALRDAAAALADVRDLLDPQRDDHALADVELIADRLRAGLDALASLGGRLSPDDVIGRVFATFCVGK